MAGKIFSFLMVVCVAFYFVVRGGTGTQGGFDIAAANFKVVGGGGGHSLLSSLDLTK